MGLPADNINLKEVEVNRPKPVIAPNTERETPASLRIIDRLDQLNLLINNSLGWLAGASLMLMVFTVVANSLSRVIYVPFTGATEVVGWLAALTTAFALGFTQIQRGYVDIDALMERFPSIVQRIIKISMDLISLCFFTMVSWKMFGYAAQVAENGNLSETMGIPFYPLIAMVAVGFIGLSLAILVDLLRQLFGGAVR